MVIDQGEITKGLSLKFSLLGFQQSWSKARNVCKQISEADKMVGTGGQIKAWTLRGDGKT